MSHLSSLLTSPPPLTDDTFNTSSSSSSSTGMTDDTDTLDSTEYPTVFLLAIFLPAVALGALFLYFHYAMRQWGELRWPWNAPGRRQRRRVPMTTEQLLSASGSGGGSLVAELRNEMSGVSAGGGGGGLMNESFDGGDTLAVGRDGGAHRMHKPLLADNIF